MVTVDPRENGPVRSSHSARHATATALGSAPHEQLADAVRQERWARAVELLQQHGERLLVDGRADDLHAWLESVPEVHFQQHYRLGLLAAWVAIYGQRLREALTRVAQAERALQHQIISDDNARRSGTAQDGDFVTLPWAEARSGIAAARAHLRAVSGDAPSATEGVDAMMLPASAEHPVWRAEALVILARSRYLAGDVVRAETDLKDALALAGTSGAARARRAEGEALVLSGRIAELRGRVAEAAAAYAAVPEGAGAIVAGAHAGRAHLALGRMALGEARTALGDAMRVLNDAASMAHGAAPDALTVTFDTAVVEAEVAALHDEHGDARARLDTLERALKDLDIRWLQDFIGPARMRLALLRDDVPYLRRQVQQLATRRPGGRGLGELMLQSALAWSQLRLDAPGDALKIAQQLREGAEVAGLDALRDEARLIAAFASWLKDADPRTLAQARSAVEACREQASLLPLTALLRVPALHDAALRDAAMADVIGLAKALVARPESRTARAEVVVAALPPAETPIVADPEPAVVADDQGVEGAEIAAPEEPLAEV